MTFLKKTLDKIHYPEDMKSLSMNELENLCNELRKETIEIVAKNGGHLGASLGVIELTISLHYVFNAPKDLLVWDIGHQAYPHKILTGRRSKMHSLRQKNGISGFTKRSESAYDPFGAGHSSTSISAALGMAIGRDLKKEIKDVVAIIGDGALSAGLAYEAMNNAGTMRSRLIVILNDNEMSIASPVGAMSKYLSRLISSKAYLNFRATTGKILNKLPIKFKKLMKKTERNTKDLINGGNFFEEMGFYYVGPIDGHDLNAMITTFKNIKEDKSLHKPVLIHVITEKARGFNSSKKCGEKYHAIGKFNPDTGEISQSTISYNSYSKVFGDSLIYEARKDDKIVAITAAMPSGTGLTDFAKEFPNRIFDVGIAEQHAVTFAAGLACEGIKPFVAIYSTFLQRALDQVIHDVAIQKLPVRFIIDRAGYVGADGPTHAGSFDIVYLSMLPNFIIMAPSSDIELANMVATAAMINDGPCAIRYPRGNVKENKIFIDSEILTIGRGKIIKRGKDIAILSLGMLLTEAINVSKTLQKEGLDITVADARFAKPLDGNLLNHLAKNHKVVITIEEGSIGGFGSYVLDYFNKHHFLDKIKVINLCYPDKFMEQDTQQSMNYESGLCADNIIKIIRSLTVR